MIKTSKLLVLAIIIIGANLGFAQNIVNNQNSGLIQELNFNNQKKVNLNVSMGLGVAFPISVLDAKIQANITPNFNINYGVYPILATIPGLFGSSGSMHYAKSPLSALGESLLYSSYISADYYFDNPSKALRKYIGASGAYTALGVHGGFDYFFYKSQYVKLDLSLYAVNGHLLFESDKLKFDPVPSPLPLPSISYGFKF